MDRIDKKREIRKNSQTNFKIRRTVNTIFGLIQTTLVFRLIFKIFGANAENQFAKIIYEITDYFVSIFENIFPHIAIGDNGVFEPEIVIAMVVS